MQMTYERLSMGSALLALALGICLREDCAAASLAPLDKTDLWSLKPLIRASVPPPQPHSWISRNPIDAFIQEKLNLNHLSPSPEATRPTLIRRLSFDLTGLPPSDEEVDRFINDQAADAYERLVDRLLSSPRYGERWARHWLDIVHYGETHGYDKDKPRPHAWPYRDYVVRAFNEDKPYARFIQEQLAGDALFPFSRDGIEALGFLSAGPWDFIGHEEVSETKIDGQIARHLDRDDMVANTLQTFNSLTVQCAQCHDHKFDPISQEEYYRLQAVFAAVDRTNKKYDVDPTVARTRDRLLRQLNALNQETDHIEMAMTNRAGSTWTSLAKQMAAAESSVAITNGHLPGLKADQDPTLVKLRSQRDALRHQSLLADEAIRLKEILEQKQSLEQSLAALPEQSQVYIAGIHHGTGSFRGTGAEGGKPRTIHILNRGNVQTPGKEVQPGVLRAVNLDGFHTDLPTGHPEADRRVLLAHWLSHTDNPLTWRSIVNRVWQYHFGRGLVDTPNDFGHMGATPSHAELLDWLALEFRDGGQSLKKLHKLIVSSATYRQVSSDPRHPQDSENRWLWRMNRRKLEAEALRDSVLWVAGKLNEQMGGPSFQDFVVEKPEHSPHYEYHLYDPEDPRSHRRSIYRFIVRSQQQPFMSALDCADPSMQVARRNESVSPLQALTLLNNVLMLAMSGHFAHRVEQLGNSMESKIQVAFRLALSRAPRPQEIAPMVDYATHHGLTNTCRLIFNLNEFAFVD